MYGYAQAKSDKTGKTGKRLFVWFSSMLLFLALIVPTLAHADPLGEHILAAILRQEKPGDAALLLLTRDLKWYEQNMGRLPEGIRDRVQQLRINVAGDSAQMAARSLNEADSVFAATGSWRPGRDADILYLGKNGDSAASAIESGYDTVTGRILAGADSDPILKAFPGEVPKKLSAGSLAVCTTELPNYGYRDLHTAYKKAKEALARGSTGEHVIGMFKEEIRQSMVSNVKAHFAAASNPDYYGGATGQEWFKKTYLDDPGRTRVFARNTDGQWTLREGGIAALPNEIVERLGFGGLDGGQVKFTKIASDYSLFFSHMHGGPSDNAKYALRVWKDMGLNAIQDLTEEELKVLVAAKAVSNNPGRANQILADLGMGNVEDLNRGIANMLYRWTETQMMRDMDRIVAELGSASGRSLDDIERILREAKGTMDLNEIVAGLNKLKSAPGGKELQTQLLEKLKAKFGNSNAGKAALQYILRNLGLLGDTGQLTGRILKTLAKMGRVSKTDLDAFEAGSELSEAVKGQVNRARKELIALNAGSMVSFDETLDLERLMEDWRRNQPGALLQSPDDGVKTLLQEMRGASSDDELKRLGWPDEDIRIQNRIKASLHPEQQTMKNFGAKVRQRIVRGGGTLQQLQSKLRDLMFNPAYTKLGDPSVSIGAFDAIVGVATALYQSYEILNGPAMSPEDEALALENAWVTSIPIVGDFAQGLITGGQAYYEGDRMKALDAGLWVTVGIVGCAPGGQLPAVVAGIVLATKPIAAAAYEARQAQNLIQAWVESGVWSGTKPRELQGLFDRQGLRHPLTYEWLLTEKANVPYSSEKFGSATINDSIRDYAEKNVMPRYPSVKTLRDALKTVYPDFNDKEWDDEFMVKIKIDTRGGKGSRILFHSYYRVRTAALGQTISHLKKWAEDEMRAARDYSGEVARLRDELKKLEAELKTGNLLSNADASVEAYSRVIKNVWEQESLPLSKLRIYEHYVKTYGEIAGRLRRVTDLMNEAALPYVPSSWHLTGYPEFDRGRVARMLDMMEAGRKGIIEHIEFLLKDMGYREARYDRRNECQKKVFDLLAPLRYKAAFAENLAEYYKQLAGGTSAWGNAYDGALKSYEESRDAALKSGGVNLKDLMGNRAMQDAFMTFVFALPYHLASGEAGLYQSTAHDYELRQVAARKDFDLAKGRGGKAGRELETCLIGDIKIDVQLSNPLPEEGEEVTATVKVVEGNVHKDVVWEWRFAGALKKKEVRADTATIVVDGRGRLTALLYDWYNPSTGKYGRILKEVSVDIAPKARIALALVISGPSETEAGRQVTYFVSTATKDPAAQDVLVKSRVEWRVNGGLVSGSDSSLSFEPKETGSYTISAAVVTDRRSGKKTAGTAAHKTLMVRASKKDVESESRMREQATQREEERKRQETLEREATERERSRMEQDEVERIRSERDQKRSEGERLKAPPACSYEYSEWGECSRATKKQTRSVTATKPEGCVEKSKPVLEQGCTPPPTEAQKRQNFMNCLCSCTQPGFWYDPADCARDKLQGVCNTRTLAYSTHLCRFMAPRAPECTSECYQRHYGKKPDSGDLDRVNRDIKAENRKNALPLELTLSPNATPIKAQYGSTINLTANVKGGIPGYTYSWSGQGSPKDNTFTFINTRKPGKYSVSVTVTDGDGSSATAAATILVEGIEVTIEKTAPAGSTIMVGDQASFKAVVKGAGDVYYLWQPHPQIEFNPFEKSATTRATFKDPGSVGIWVEVFMKDGDAMRSVGRSNEITIQVANPQWSIEFSPVAPKVGQPVKAKMTPTGPNAASTNTSEMNFRWQIPANAKQTGTSKDDREITFVLSDGKPARISCMASTKRANANIGSAGKTITARSYQVTVSGPRARQVVEVWKCETQLGGAPSCGMKKAENQFAVDNEILFSSKIEPAPERPVSYSWTVSPAGCTIASPFSKDIGLKCSATGNYGVTVKAKSDGMDLGSASANVNVTISRDDQNNSRKSKDAYEKLRKAKTLVSQGGLDDGIDLARAAQGLDPKNVEAASLTKRWSAERKKVKDHLNASAAYIQEGDPAKAGEELGAARKLHPKYPSVLEAEKRLKRAVESSDRQKKESAERMSRAKTLVSQGKLDEGIAAVSEALRADPNNAEATALATGWKSEMQTVTRHIQEAGKLARLGKIADAEKEVSAARMLHPKYGPVIETEKLVADAKKRLADKQRTEETARAAAHIKELLKQNRLDEAKKAAEELSRRDPSSVEAKNLLQEIDKTRIRQQEALRTCEAKWTEGKALYDAGRHAEALVKFRENIACAPGSKDREAYLRKLDDSLKKQAAAKQQCLAARQQGDGLVQQKRYGDAIARYRESLRCQPDPKLEAYIGQLEAEMKKQADKQAAQARAGQLRDEGTVLQNQKRYGDAIARYRESLRYLPDTALEDHIVKLEAEMKRQADAQANAARAKQLRSEGEALQKQGKVPEAIARYKEYLRYAPNDTAMANHVKTLEAKLVDDQRKIQYAMQLRLQGEALQKQGKVPEAIARYKEYLRYAPNDTAMANHVRDLESRTALSMDTTGGVGRIHTSEPAGPTPSSQTPEWTGAWRSDPGREGEVITFALSTSGNRITGSFSVVAPYKTSSGVRNSEVMKGPLEGTLSGNRATGTFYPVSDRENDGTFELVMASGSNQFSCSVRSNKSGERRTYSVLRAR